MTIKPALPVMREQGVGSIVNISSLASIAGGNQVAYEVSKAGHEPADHQRRQRQCRATACAATPCCQV